MADRHRKRPGGPGRNRLLVVGAIAVVVVVVVVVALVLVVVLRSSGSGDSRSAYCDKLQQLPLDSGLRQAVDGASASQLDAIRQTAPGDVEQAWDDLVRYREGDASFSGTAGRAKVESDLAVVVLDASEHCDLTIKP